MPVRIAICLLLLGSCARLPAQEDGSPRIEVAATEWQFGEKEQGDRDEMRLVVRNRGKAPLEILYAKVTCGCLEAVIEDRSIAPGDEGAVLIKLDAAKQQGEIKKQVFIGSNDPRRPRVDLLVQGFIHPRILLEPAQLDLGVVDPDAAEVTTQEVLLREGLDIPLLGVDVGLPNMLEVKTEAFGETEGRHGYRLHFKPLSGLPRGQRIQVPIRLRFEDEMVPSLGSAVAVEAVGILRLSADRIDFGEIEAGETGRVELVLEHRGGKEFRLTSLRALDPAILIEADLDEAAARHVVKLSRKGEGPGSSITGRLYVVTDLAEQRMLSLPVAGKILRKR